MIDPWTCVAISGTLWPDDATNFLLWQAAEPEVILFTPHVPMLGVDPITKRYQAAINILRDPASGKLTGGTVSFLVNTGTIGDPDALARLQKQWKERLANDPNNKGPAAPVFRALNTQNEVAKLIIDPIWGTWLAGPAETDIGTPGGLAAFDIQLTAQGAAEWFDCITNHKPPSGSIVMNYEYLRALPTCEVNVKIDGKKVYNYFAAHLKVGYGSILFGASADIGASWKAIQDSGGITVEWVGPKPDPTVGIDIDKLEQLFIDQALKGMFDVLFKPVNDPKLPDGRPATGLGWNTQFQFQWAHESDALDLSLKILVESASWLKESMDITIGGLLSVIDQSYLTVINEQTQFPIHYKVLGNPDVAEADLAIQSYSDGTAVDSRQLSCGPTGGMIDFTLSTFDPQKVSTQYTLKIAYSGEDGWADTTVSQQLIGQAGQIAILKSGQYVSYIEIFMTVKGKNGILVDAADTLTLSIHVSSKKQSVDTNLASELKPTLPIRITWPRLPGEPDDVTISIEGSGQVQGNLVQLSATSLPIDKASQRIVVETDGSVSVLGGDKTSANFHLTSVPSSTNSRRGDGFQGAFVISEPRPGLRTLRAAPLALASDSTFEDDPFFRGPKVASNLEDIVSLDMQLLQPLAVRGQHNGTSEEDLKKQECDAALQLADRLAFDLDILEGDIFWIQELSKSPSTVGVDPSSVLAYVSQLSSYEKRAAAAWVQIHGSLAALAALCTSIQFGEARDALTNFISSVRAGREDGTLGQSLKLTRDRTRAALAILEGGILANQGDMIVSAVHAYEAYIGAGLESSQLAMYSHRWSAPTEVIEEL